MATSVTVENPSVDHWEDHTTEAKFSALSVEDTQDGVREQSQGDQAQAPSSSLVFGPEPPILVALMESKERATVLRIEDDVLRFISDSSRDVLEFPGTYTNYQRMLAHKVAQYHGLHTSTVDYENGVARVVAHRRSVQDKAKPKLSTIDVTPEQVAAISAMTAKGSTTDRPKLLRRPSGHDANRPGSEQWKNTSAPRNPKEREEEYAKARERIMGGAAADSIVNGRSMGRGFQAGRGPALPVPGNPGFAANGRGRGRKGNLRDRALDDPDYVRGLNRYTGMPGMMYGDSYMQQAAMYGMPHYPMDPTGQMVMPGTSPKGGTSAGMGQAYGGQGQTWAIPPPAPPPGAPGASSKQGAFAPPPPPVNAPGATGQKGASASSMPSTPTGSSASHQGMHPHMPGGVRPYAMPMPGFPMPMGGVAYAGMPGTMPQGAMYPAGGMPGYGYGMPPGSYPYAMVPGVMPHPSAADPSGMQQQQQAAMGGYPMYPMGPMPMHGPSGQWGMGMPRMPVTMYQGVPGMPYPGMPGGDMGHGYGGYHAGNTGGYQQGQPHTHKGPRHHGSAQHTSTSAAAPPATGSNTAAASSTTGNAAAASSSTPAAAPAPAAPPVQVAHEQSEPVTAAPVAPAPAAASTGEEAAPSDQQ